MAVDMFLWIDGEIKGESQDKSHKDDIDVLAWSWGMSQSGTFHVGAGGGAGKANFQDLSLTKWVDRASPVLMRYVASGDHFARAILVVRKAGKTPLEYIKFTMTKVMVTSLATGGSGGEDRLTENVSLNFSQVEFEYVEQTEKGSAGLTTVFDWDINRNDAVKGRPAFVPPIYVPPLPPILEDSPIVEDSPIDEVEDSCADATEDELHDPFHPCYPENRW